MKNLLDFNDRDLFLDTLKLVYILIVIKMLRYLQQYKEELNYKSFLFGNCISLNFTLNTEIKYVKYNLSEFIKNNQNISLIFAKISL